MEVGRTVIDFLKDRAPGRLGPQAGRDRGATAVEYGLMVALIAIAIIGSVTAFGGSVKGLFDSIVLNYPFIM